MVQLILLKILMKNCKTVKENKIYQLNRINNKIFSTQI